MPMTKKYQRKEFLKLALMTNLGLYATPLNFLVSKNLLTGKDDNVLYYKKGDAEYDILRKGFNKRIEKFIKKLSGNYSFPCTIITISPFTVFCLK